MVESAGVVSLQMMKIGTAAEKQLINDDDQSRNVKSTEKSHQLLNLHISQSNDVKSVAHKSSEQNSTNNISSAAHISNLGERRFSPICSYTSRRLRTHKCGNGLNCVCSTSSSSLPSFPLKNSLEFLANVSSKSISNFKLAKQNHDGSKY